MFRHLKVAAALAVVGLFGLGMAATPASASIGEFKRIQNVDNLLCLQPQTLAFGSRVVQEDCDNSAAQSWAPLYMGSNHYRFINQAAGLCLSSFVLVNNGPVALDNCQIAGGTTVSNAEWNTGALLPNTVTLRSRLHFVDNNFCLDVPGRTKERHVVINVFTCNGTPAQRWFIGFA